ncbi:MAG TPA: copper-containing nitrite reductase [Chloroflexota bacterium]|jgi:nitrite reductase (NO-forming)
MSHEPVPPLLRLGWRHVFLALIGVGAVAIACIPSAARDRQAVATPTTQAPAALGATPEAALLPLPPDTPRVPQGQIAPPVHRNDPELVKVNLAIQEVVGQLADGVGYRYWTFGGTVPGPMIRVRQGDTVELTLTNPPGVQLPHSINVHAAIGPGGGAVQIPPGEQNTFRFKAEHPGVWVYHCMTPTVGMHVANGMFGLVVVEPPEGLPPVDREFYVMQSEAYLQGDPKAAGMHDFAFDKLLREQPDYVMYNGSVGSLTDAGAMVASVGDRVRFFFGVSGPNLDSAFHIVGLAWDRVHPEGATETLSDVQTTLVPPGGATITELTLTVPGTFMMEDHHITRLEKGAFAHLQVQGADNPAEFEQNAHHDAGTPVRAAPQSPFSITEERLP